MEKNKYHPFHRTISYFLEILIPLVILAVLASAIVISIMKKNVISRAEADITRSAAELTAYINQIENLALEISTNRQIQELVLTENNYYTSPRAQSSVFDSIMGYHRYSSLNIKSVKVINSDQENTLSLGLMQTNQYDHDELFLSDTEDSLWVMNGDTTYYTAKDKSYNIISFYHKIYRGTSRQTIGFVRVDIDETMLRDNYLNSTVPNNTNIYLLLKPGTLVASNASAEAYDPENISARIRIEQSVSEQFELIHVINTARILEYTNYLLPILFVILAFIIFLSLVACRFIKRVIKPLQQLSALAQNQEMLSLSPMKPLEYNKELSDIYTSFMNMIKKQKEATRESQLAKTLYLQSQINPHFLYNALDSLRWVALSNKDDVVAKELFHLSRLFRYYLNQGDTFVPIREEIDLIDNYIAIHNFRNPGKITFDVYDEDVSAGCYIPKILLQPLVENAVIHGFEEMDVNCRIVMRIRRRGQKIVIHIWDNGSGIEQDRLETLNNGTDYKGTSYAVTNIRKRLTLYFEGNFRLHFSSKKDRGTIVHLSFPMITEPVK